MWSRRSGRGRTRCRTFASPARAATRSLPRGRPRPARHPPSPRSSHATTFRPDVVHSHVVQGMGVAALTEPGDAGLAHVHTLHDYWLLCQRNSMVQRDGTACLTALSLVSRDQRDPRTARSREQPPDVVHRGFRGRRAASPRRARVDARPHAGDLQPGRRPRAPAPGARRVRAGHVRVLRPARARTRGSARCWPRSRSRRGTRASLTATPGSWSPDGARGAGRAAAAAGVEYRGWVDAEREGRAARGARLPGRAVGVGGSGAARGQRGAESGHPRDRFDRRRDPGADRARERGVARPAGRRRGAGGRDRPGRRRARPIPPPPAAASRSIGPAISRPSSRVPRTPPRCRTVTERGRTGRPGGTSLH